MASTSAAASAVQLERQQSYVLPPMDEAPAPRVNASKLYQDVKGVGATAERELQSLDKLFTRSATLVLGNRLERGQQPDYLASLSRHRQTYVTLTARLQEAAGQMEACYNSPLYGAADTALYSANRTVRNLGEHLEAFASNMDTVQKLQGIMGKLQSCEGHLEPAVLEGIRADIAAMQASKTLLMLPTNVQGAIQGLNGVVLLASTDSYNSDFYPALHELQSLFETEDSESDLKGLEDAMGQLRQLEAFAASSREQSQALQSKLAASSEKLYSLCGQLEQTGTAIRGAFEEYQGLQGQMVQLLGSQISGLEKASGIKDGIIQQLHGAAQETGYLRDKLEQLTQDMARADEVSKKTIAALSAEKEALAAKTEAFRNVIFNIDSWTATVRAQVAPAVQAPAQ